MSGSSAQTLEAHALLLYVALTPADTLHVSIRAITPGLRTLLGLAPDLDLGDLTICELNPHTSQVLEEWTAFLHKTLVDWEQSDGDSRESDTVSRTIIQFFPFFKGWAATTLRLDRRTRQASVSFATPGDLPTALDALGNEEKNRTRERLSLNESRFRNIVESSPDLFIAIGPDGDISYVSPCVQDMLGYQSRDLLNRPFRILVTSAQEKSRLMSKFAEVMGGGSFPAEEYRLLCRDGTFRWFMVRMSAILSAYDGKVAEVVAVCRDLTEEKSRAENLQYINAHDTLTGVYNRVYFNRELDNIQEKDIVNVGLILTDLNGLKNINDTLGHWAGDEMLIKTAEMLSGITIRRHCIARVGGDEFALLIFHSTPEEMTDLCEHIDTIFKEGRNGPLPISVSWGSAYRHSTGQNMRVLFKQAEGRMYSNKLLDTRSMHNQLLSSLKKAMQARDVETSDHTERMENMVITLGKRLGLPPSEFDRLVLLASMHDIGKVAIPDSIIHKPGPLNREEWAIMRTHSEVGCQIAMTSRELSCIAHEIGCHHEHWNGDGYPYGLKGGKIPLLSRIISVVDAYDVMAHKRKYKEAVEHQTAIAELQRCAGTQFDPKIVELFVSNFAELPQLAV